MALVFATRTYLNLQRFAATEREVVHVNVGVIGIASTLVFHKCETVLSVRLLIVHYHKYTHSLLEGLRGAGMSHRTRRPNRSNSYAKSRARVFGLKPVTYRVVPLREDMAKECLKV